MNIEEQRMKIGQLKPITHVRQLSYLLTRRDKRNGLILFCLLLGGAVLEVVGLGSIPVFVGIVSAPDRLMEYAIIRNAFALVGAETSVEIITWAALGLLSVFIVKNLYMLGLAYAQARYLSHRQVSVSTRLFEAYLHSPYHLHIQRNTSELLRNASNEVGRIMSGVLMPVMTVAMEGILLLLVFAMLLVADPLVSLVAVGVMGGITFLYLRTTRRIVADFAQQEQRHRTVTVKSINEGLGGLKLTRILGRESYFLNSYRNSVFYQAKAGQYRSIIQSLPRAALETIAVLGMLGATLILVAQDRSAESILPILTLLAVASVRMIPSFTQIASAITDMKWGVWSLNAVHKDLVMLERIREEEARARVDGAHVMSFEDRISLHDVSFTYGGSERPALSDISLEIGCGSSVAFVGPSGCGKTTLVDVIMGLLSPDTGSVNVDGKNIRDNLREWQRHIGYIPQEIYLTDDSIRRNIAFGVDDSEIDDEQVWRALEAAQLLGFVSELPSKLDTRVGERGVRLSGGQRQRIGIARALYHDPAVLIMDEATSALDNQTERSIVNALVKIRAERTLIIIAHRLSTVQACDTLFFLDRGRLVASGSYGDLLLSNGRFAEMAAVEI